MAIPVVAPCPASPTICSDPTLEAKREHPIAKKPTFLPAKKYSWVLVFLRELHQAIPPIAPKYTAITSQSQPTKVDSIV